MGIFTNTIFPTAGERTSEGNSNFGGGIIQVQSRYKSDKYSTTSTSYTDVSNLHVNITTASSTSKVLLFGCLRIGSGGGNLDNKYRFLRGSTQVGDENFCRLTGSSETFVFSDMMIDNPGSAATHNYKVQIKAESNEVFINRDGSNRDHGVSYIICMEVASWV